ncbi:LamG-like jellyroll fold domain-containing protein [Chloroflexota bacterium]
MSKFTSTILVLLIIFATVGISFTSADQPPAVAYEVAVDQAGNMRLLGPDINGNWNMEVKKNETKILLPSLKMVNDLEVALNGAINDVRSELLNDLAGAVDDLRNELHGVIDGLRDELQSSVDDLGIELIGEMDGLRSELQMQIDGLRGELLGEMDELWNGLMAEVQSAIDDLRGQLLGEMDELRNELMAEVQSAIDDLRGQLLGEMDELRNELQIQIASGDAATAGAAQAANDALQALLEAAIASGDAATTGAAQAANDALLTLLEAAIASGDAAMAGAAQAANDALQALLEAAIDSGDAVTADAAQAANDALQALLVAAIASGDAATADAAQATNDALQALMEAAIASGDAATAGDAQAANDALLALLEVAVASGDAATAGAAQAANDALQALLEAAIASGDAATADAAQAANDALLALLEAAIASGDTATAGAAQAANDALQALLEAAIASGDTATAGAAQAANDILQALLEAAIASGDAATADVAQAAIDALQSDIVDLQSQINDLINRVTALEGGTDVIAPYTLGHIPAAGDADVAVDSNIVVHVIDDGLGVDQSTITMTVEGTDVTSSLVITGIPSDYMLFYDPPTDFFYGQIVDVVVTARDLAAVPNAMTPDSYTFSMEVDPGLVLYTIPEYTEPSATILEDHSIYENNGAFKGIGQPNWVQLPSGIWVMSFDGDDYVDLGSPDILENLTSQFSISLWVHASAWLNAEGQIDFLSKYDGANKGFFFRYINYSAPHMRFYTGSGAGTSYAYAASLNAEQWYHLVGTWDGTNVNLYIDAVAGTSATAASLTETTKSLYLGRASYSSSRFYSGMMALVKIYNRVLDQNEIAVIYNQERHLFE